MRKFRVLFLVVIWFTLFIVPCWALGLEVAGGVWRVNPSGDVSYKGDSISTDELGLGKKTTGYGRVKLDLPLINFYLMATPMRFKGKGQKTVNFTFGDKTFKANVPFDSKFRIDQYDLGIYWGIPLLKSVTKVASLGNFAFNLEFGLNVKVVDLYAKITQNTTNLSAEKHLTVPVPMLYLGADIEFWKLALEVEGRGITYDGHYLYDTIARVKAMPVSIPLVAHFFIEGGYHYQKIKIQDISDITGKLEFSGPFVGIGGAF